jgi:hypothetical protein
MNLYTEYANVVANKDYYIFASLGSENFKGLANPRSPTDEALREQDNILLSAKFIDIVLAQCTQNRTCKLPDALGRSLADIESFRSSPAASVSEGASYFANIANLDALVQSTFGIGIAGALVNKPSALQNLVSPGYLAIAKTWAAANSAVAIASFPPDPSRSPYLQRQIDDGSIGQNGFDYYYYWVAIKPIFRGGRLPGSSTDAAAELDLKLLLTEDESKVLDDATFLQAVTRRYRIWLLENKLLPISMSFCKISAAHPMCLSAGRLKQILGRVDILLNPAELRPKALPVSTTPPPVVAPPNPPKPPKDDYPDCHHRC